MGTVHTTIVPNRYTAGLWNGDFMLGCCSHYYYKDICCRALWGYYTAMQINADLRYLNGDVLMNLKVIEGL